MNLTTSKESIGNQIQDCLCFSASRHHKRGKIVDCPPYFSLLFLSPLPLSLLFSSLLKLLMALSEILYVIAPSMQNIPNE